MGHGGTDTSLTGGGVVLNQRPELRGELRSCVKVEEVVLVVPNKPTVSVDVKQHFIQLRGERQTASVDVKPQQDE